MQCSRIRVQMAEYRASDIVTQQIRSDVQRLFLDETVLYMAARRRDARALRFWKLAGVQLCTSDWEVQVAKFNLDTDPQRRRFSKLTKSMDRFKPVKRELPKSIPLWKRDLPSLLAAIEARADYLVTFESTFPARLFGKRIACVQVITPAQYFALQQANPITPSVRARLSSSRTAVLRRSRRRRGE